MISIRRMLLLMTAAVATCAFVAPAIAQAEADWYVNGQLPGEPVAFEATGELSWTFSPGVTVGSCPVTASGELENRYNESEGEWEARGEIVSFSITPSCFAGEPICQVVETTNNTIEAEETWPISANNIDNVKIKNQLVVLQLDEGCPYFGKGTLAFEGSPEGSWSDATGCIKYTGSDVYFVGLYGENPVKLTGKLCLTTAEGPIMLRNSPPSPPTVVTGAATHVMPYRATLNGSVNPEGLPATYQFEYGTTTSYGKVLPASAKSAGSGTSNVAVSALTNQSLEPNTTYHYRLVATSGAGVSEGSDETFKTGPVVPNWHDGNGWELEDEEPLEFDATGELSWVWQVNELHLGTCSLSVEGVLENVGGSPHGQVTSLTPAGSCLVGAPNCYMEITHNATEDGDVFPLSAEGSEVNINDVEMSAVWSSSCPQPYPPVELTFVGTMHSNKFNNETGCMLFSHQPGMSIAETSLTLKLDGELCLTIENGEAMPSIF